MTHNRIKPAYRDLLEAILDVEILPADMEKTPDRFANACTEWFAGYTQNAQEILSATFESEGLNEYNGMVVVKDIEFYSHCEHHGAPFFGTVDIVIVPDGKVIGISKPCRLVDMYTRRFQTQERITQQIADAIMKHLDPVGCMVVVNAKHMCMCSRGVNKQQSRTTTSIVRGCLYSQENNQAHAAAARAEAMWLINR